MQTELKFVKQLATGLGGDVVKHSLKSFRFQWKKLPPIFPDSPTNFFDLFDPFLTYRITNQLRHKAEASKITKAFKSFQCNLFPFVIFSESIKLASIAMLERNINKVNG